MRRRPFLAVTTLVVLAAAGPASAATGLKDSYLGIPTFIWLPVNLALFVYLLYHFVGKPISLYLDTRKAAIATDISDAAAKLAEAEELRAQVMARLDAVEAEIKAIHDKAEQDGQTEAAAIADQAAHEQERFLKRVDDELARRRIETRRRLASETAELTAQITREILEREMTADDRALVFQRSLAALDRVGKES
jgi:ATP synthase F0 subunit b